MTIWVNEQIDPSGMIHACIATCNESQAKDCVARLRTVDSWDEVPVNSLKLN